MLTFHLLYAYAEMVDGKVQNMLYYIYKSSIIYIVGEHKNEERKNCLTYQVQPDGIA